jgi:predicted phage-related endonuclease
MRELETAQETAEAAIKFFMRDAEALDYANETIATWKNTTGFARFDLKRFQAEHADLYETYLSEPKPSRRFLLKEKAKCLLTMIQNPPTLNLATEPLALLQPSD